MIIVTLTLVMRAGNDGGGSIMALITLLRRYGGARGRRTAMRLAALGRFGATVFFGETMITAAISPGSDMTGPRELVHGERESFIGEYSWQRSGLGVGSPAMSVAGGGCSRVSSRR